jgi:serine/threonine protein kinase
VPLAVGTIIAGRYEVRQSLGRGGVGEVYEARQTETGQLVALKLLHPYVRQDEAIHKRFLREARAAGLIASPYVARVIALIDDAAEGPAIAFELLRGETLHERLRRVPRLPPREVDLLVSQGLRGLHDAHAAGVVHRDLKPANIFLEQQPGAPFGVKLLDFGISKLAETLVTPLTRPQQSLGSLSFMPPEQFERAALVDHRADLYALGTVVFRVLTGELPYPSSTLSELLTRKRHDAPRSLASVGLPPDPALEAWMARMIARDPSARFGSAAEALAAWFALPPTLEVAPISVPPPSAPAF